MERTLTSSWFLASTAVSCGLAAAFTTWATNDSPGGLRALAALIGVGAVLAVMLLVAWAVAAEGAPAAATPERATASRETPERGSTQSNHVPEYAAASRETPELGSTPSNHVPESRTALAQLLTDGLALRDEIEPHAADPRVGAWIARVGRTIERHKPGVAGYVNALGQRAYPDDRERLDAYIKRLTTVVRDLI